MNKLTVLNLFIKEETFSPPGLKGEKLIVFNTGKILYIIARTKGV